MTRPSLLFRGADDAAITRAAVRDAGRFVAGPFRLVELAGVSHWVPEEAADRIAADLVAHLRGDSRHGSH